ncbi:hypothetical protein DY000_02007009 [Brassica cretica]|uniref:Uncharacterized protein n=1 Tax=Brassica cretica TaxID=69181 RepID=A0ABQ7BYR2_BRACR|nr:hypothetical protein DY000_02007009 [Brassica cretica]
MSSRKGSSKRNSSSHSSSGDSSANEVIAPKEEFEVEEEAKDTYYKLLCGSPPPSQDIPIPKRPVRSPNTPLTPSMVSPDYLTTLRDFYQIPSGVVFRIPSGNESAKNPPEGFFTCYEAFLVYCRMWHSIKHPDTRSQNLFFDCGKFSKQITDTTVHPELEVAEAMGIQSHKRPVPR